MIGKLVHISADLVLVLAFLAGVRRNTNLSPNIDSIQSTDVRYYAQKYLNVGETVFDYSVGYFGSTDYFKRK